MSSYFFNITSFSKWGHIQALVNVLFILSLIIIVHLCFHRYFLNMTSSMSCLHTCLVIIAYLSMDQIFCNHFKINMHVAQLISFYSIQVSFPRFSHICKWLHYFLRHPGLLNICCRWWGNRKLEFWLGLVVYCFITNYPMI